MGFPIPLKYEPSTVTIAIGICSKAATCKHIAPILITSISCLLMKKETNVLGIKKKKQAKIPIKIEAIIVEYKVYSCDLFGLFSPMLCPTSAVHAMATPQPGIVDIASIAIPIWFAAKAVVPKLKMKVSPNSLDKLKLASCRPEGTAKRIISQISFLET